MLVAISASAQIRLHDAANDELAKKTRDAFADFSKGDANVYETMLSNTLALKTATLAQLYELNRQNRRDTVNIIPVLTWRDLLEKEVPRTQKEFLDAYNASRLILDPLFQNLPDIKAALADAQKQLASAKKKKDDKEAELNIAQPDLDKLKTSLGKLKDAAVASSKPVKKLTDLTEFSNLKAVWKDILAVKDWLDAADKASNAPGLQLTILDLAVQHQQFNVERLKLQVEEADAAQKRTERIAQRLSLVWGDGNIDPNSRRATQGLFGEVYRAIAPGAAKEPELKYPFVTDQDEQVLETIGKLASAAEKEIGKPLSATLKLRDLLDILGRYVTLVGYQKYLLLSEAIEAGVDVHLFSIRFSALNTKDREMLVSHGLDGLAAYYAGGLKPEEIANFFRAAQSIALGVLAGRVQ